MDEPFVTTKLFNDLYALEKTYKQTLTSLKLKEEELERYRLSNKLLEENSIASTEEIRVLKNKVHNVEKALYESEQKRGKEKELCQDVINRLTMKINETNRKYKVDCDWYESEMKRRCNDVENVHVKISEELRVNIREIQAELQKENTNKLKYKKQSEEFFNENMSLRNKLREVESQYIPELTILKDELKTIRGDNNELKMEIETLQKELELSNLNATTYKSENEIIKKECKQKEYQFEKLIKENNERKVHNNELNVKLQECLGINRDLIIARDKDEKENRRLEAELVRVNAEINERKNSCCIPEHCKYDEILKQNGVLREIVRGMKVERERILNLRDANTENRIQKLEILIEQLKKSFANNHKLLIQ